jgi:hypothetical protein
MLCTLAHIHWMLFVLSDKLWIGVLWFGFLFPFLSKLLTWLAMRDALSTGRKLLGWGFQGDVKRIFCRFGIEDRDHLFFSCGFSGRIWKKVMGLYGACVESTHLLG